MTRDAFTTALESELRLLGVPCDRGKLLAWVAGVWPGPSSGPGPGLWAREFLRVTREAARPR